MTYLSTTNIGNLCGCSRVWAFSKARDGFFDKFKLAGWNGKHYRFKDSPKLRAQCAAIKADRARARLPKPKPSKVLIGIASWQALSIDFDLLKDQVGDVWKEWDG